MDLNQVVVDKLAKRINRGGQNASLAMERLMREAGISKDFIGYVGRDEQRRNVLFGSNGHVFMEFNEEDYYLHKHPVGQLAERLAIPGQYLKSLVFGNDEQRFLAAIILNKHSEWTNRNRVLIRTVGEEVRGVLSDKYRRLNSHRIVAGFLEEAINQGAALADGHFTDTKLFVETLLPKPIIFPTPKNGDVAIAYGARLSTSDYGDGALDMRVFMMQGACLNGMVRESVVREVHLGKRLPESLEFSERTYELDTQATTSAIRDCTQNLFNVSQIEKSMREIQAASAEEVDIVKELRNLQKNNLTKNEAEKVQAVLLENRPDDGITGESTLWKLVQGITAVSREMEPERQRELQEIGGRLMDRVAVK